MSDCCCIPWEPKRPMYTWARNAKSRAFRKTYEPENAIGCGAPRRRWHGRSRRIGNTTGSWGSNSRSNGNRSFLYPLIYNQPFTGKGVPTTYATDPPCLPSQTDDHLVPGSNRFGCLSSGDSFFPVSHAGAQSVSGEADTCYGDTLSPLDKTSPRFMGCMT
jgi:hypothetical protein